MTKFHEGQDVEILVTISSCGNADFQKWTKAKIVKVLPGTRYETDVPLTAGAPCLMRSISGQTTPAKTGESEQQMDEAYEDRPHVFD